MAFPKNLNEQAYAIGREHGARRARAAITAQVLVPIEVPPEFSGHRNAVCQYGQGQHDGYAFVMDAHGAKYEARRLDLIESGAEEMDRLEEC